MEGCNVDCSDVRLCVYGSNLQEQGWAVGNGYTMQPHFAYQRELCAKNCNLQINLDMYVVQCAYSTPTPLTFIVGS